MDQVIGRVDLAAGAAQRLRTQDIPLVQFESVVFERPRPAAAAFADEASHLMSRRGESACETAANKPGRAGDQHTPTHAAAAFTGVRA